MSKSQSSQYEQLYLDALDILVKENCLLGCYAVQLWSKFANILGDCTTSITIIRYKELKAK
jgi:hypothetical protein